MGTFAICYNYYVFYFISHISYFHRRSISTTKETLSEQCLSVEEVLSKEAHSQTMTEMPWSEYKTETCYIQLFAKKNLHKIIFLIARSYEIYFSRDESFVG